MSARVLSVNVGRPVAAGWAGSLGRTAINKTALTGPVRVRIQFPFGLISALGTTSGPTVLDCFLASGSTASCTSGQAVPSAGGSLTYAAIITSSVDSIRAASGQSGSVEVQATDAATGGGVTATASFRFTLS